MAKRSYENDEIVVEFSDEEEKRIKEIKSRPAVKFRGKSKIHQPFVLDRVLVDINLLYPMEA